MPNIITTSQLQKTIGRISDTINEQSYIVTNHGEGKIVMLPYFDGCDDTIAEYMEDFEMKKNRSVLQKRYEDSLQSGASAVVI